MRHPMRYPISMRYPGGPAVAPPWAHPMTEAVTETCDCPDPHPTADGRCANPSIRSDELPGAGLERLTQCGCCMADCPDVHPSLDDA